jgi:hypothetical protein
VARKTPAAHHPECSSVTESAFVEKILDNKKKNGRYYWFERFAHAHTELGAHRCQRCH